MIFLLRHGETEGVHEKRFIGQIDLRLSQKGVQQAMNWRRAFENDCFDQICSSSLIRSQDFAKLICPKRNVDVFPEFREICLGKWEGIAMHEIRKRFPEEWEARGRDISGYRPPEGESFTDLFSRVIPAFESVAMSAFHKKILIVAHAGVNRMILCHILGMPLNRLFSIGQEYGALNIIRCQENNHRIVSGMNLPFPAEGYF
jgi:probable phosphoglycerate mutase